MNRRNLKKLIRCTCGDIAGECLFASNLIPQTDKATLDQAIIDAAMLQTSALKRVGIDFDKTPGDFGSRADYAKARRKYFAKAYTALKDDFNKQVMAIVKEMNSALPARKAE